MTGLPLVEERREPVECLVERLQPEAGRALGRRKAENVLATDAEATDPSATLVGQ